MARTAGDPAGAINALRTSLGRADPELALTDVGTGAALAGAATVLLTVVASVAGLLGVLALVLAMAGLSGVLSDLVARRTREVGVRMALGADAGMVLRMILRDALRPVAGGLLIGLALCGIAVFALRPIVVRLVPDFNIATVLLVPVLFLAAAVLAAYFPARRAARTSPMAALRSL